VELRLLRLPNRRQPAADRDRKRPRLTPPTTRIDIVRDTYFGTTVEDPYRWMEDWKGEELQAWVKAQAAYSRSVLDTLPERDVLATRIAQLNDASPILSNLQLAGGCAFYLRRDPGENLPKLIVRATMDASETVLVDPNTFGDAVHTAIDWYSPSPDGRRVAFGTSQGGSEQSMLQVIDVDTQALHDLRIPGTIFNAVMWCDDGRSFTYHRLRERAAGAPETERYFDSCTYLHQLGDDPAHDRKVFGRDVSVEIEIAHADRPFISISPASDWIIGVVVHSVFGQLSLYAAPRSVLLHPTTTPWTKIADVSDGIVWFDIHGDQLYLRTHKDAPRFKIIRISLAAPDLPRAEVIVPEGRAVLQDFKVVGENVLTRSLDGGIWRLQRVYIGDPAGPGDVETVPLPFNGTITGGASDPTATTVLLQMTSWTVSPRVYRYDTVTGAIDDTGWLAPSPIDFSDIEAHELHVPSKDGTEVPLSLIHRKGIRHDGNNPTLLIAYGAYGLTIEPAFLPTMRVWYDRGGIYAVAHVRGGGEYGETWHKAGQKLNKQNSIDDFIACAEYLIAQGYTRPEKLAGQGTSAGGIVIGGALVQRPDLWAAMIIRVGVTNTLRNEVTESGAVNVAEHGSVTDEDGFKALLSADAYLQVKDGVAYGAVLLTTGLNDPRVVLWQATKMTARLQTATSSGKPVLLRVEEHGGHGFGSTRGQDDAETADRLAFLLSQFGI